MIRSRTKFEALEVYWYRKMKGNTDILCPDIYVVDEIEIYNRTAKERIGLNRNTEIRYACAVAYLALIEEVEKYVRYEPDHPNYIRNTVDARDMYDMAFGLMR